MNLDIFGTSDSARSEPEKKPTHQRKIKRKLPDSDGQGGATSGIFWSARDFCPLTVIQFEQF